MPLLSCSQRRESRNCLESEPQTGANETGKILLGTRSHNPFPIYLMFGMWEGQGREKARIWKQDRREARCHTERAVVFLKVSVAKKTKYSLPFPPPILCSFLQFIGRCCQCFFCVCSSSSLTVTVTITALNLQSVHWHYSRKRWKLY